MKPLLLTLAAFVVASSGRAAETVRSPDGKVVVSVELKKGRPLWSVAHGESKLIYDGLLGVETAPDNLCGTYRLVGTETATGDTTWKPVWGFLSEVRDHYNQLTVKLEETAAAKRLLHVVLRTYNEGAAVRYVFPQQPELQEVTVKKLLTEFKFGGDHVTHGGKPDGTVRMNLQRLTAQLGANLRGRDHMRELPGAFDPLSVVVFVQGWGDPR